jgi:hypothetical protein
MMMHKKQIKALAYLERAFAACEKAELAFAGMDGKLLVWDAHEFRKLTKNESICDQQYKDNGDQGDTVNTHNCYIDSGGW